MGKTVPLVDHIQPKAAVPGDRPQEDVASPAVDVVDPLIEHDDAGEMSAIDDVYFGQGFLVDFFETVGDVFTGKLVAGPEAMAEQNGVLFEEVFVYVNDFEGGDGKVEEAGQAACDVFIDKGPGSLDGVVFEFHDILASVAEEDQLRTGTSPGHPPDMPHRSYRHDQTVLLMDFQRLKVLIGGGLLAGG
jgi:hypothetical protein